MVTFKELLERAKTEKIVVHTATEDQAIALLEALDKRNYKWFFSGEKLTTKTHYKRYKEDTCYDFSADIDGSKLDKEVCFSPLDWYQDEGYTIIEFENILLK